MFWIVGGGASSGLADEDCHLRTAVLDCDVLVTRFVTRRNANERHCRDATEVGIIFLSTMQVANKVFPWAERVEESLKWWECGKPSQYFVIIVISFIFHPDGNVCTATEKPSNSHDALTWLSAQVRRKKKGKTQNTTTTKTYAANNNSDAFLGEDAPTKGVNLVLATPDCHGNDEFFHGEWGKIEWATMLSIVYTFELIHSCSVVHCCCIW